MDCLHSISNELESTRCSSSTSLNPRKCNGHRRLCSHQKKNGTFCFWVEYRRLNALMVWDPYQIRPMHEWINWLGEATSFSILDTNNGQRLGENAREDRQNPSYIASWTFSLQAHAVWTQSWPRNVAALRKRDTSDSYLAIGARLFLWYVGFSTLTEDHIDDVGQVLTLLYYNGVTLRLAECDFSRTKKTIWEI